MVSPNSQRLKKRRDTWRAQSRACSSLSLTSQRICPLRSAGNGAYVWKETVLREMVASRPKVSSCPNGSTSPGNYGWLFVCIWLTVPLWFRFWVNCCWPSSAQIFLGHVTIFFCLSILGVMQILLTGLGNLLRNFSLKINSVCQCSRAKVYAKQWTHLDSSQILYSTVLEQTYKILFFQSREVPGIKIFHYCGGLNFATRSHFKNELYRLVGINPQAELTRMNKLASNSRPSSWANSRPEETRVRREICQC
jgi:hypothetical protein